MSRLSRVATASVVVALAGFAGAVVARSRAVRGLVSGRNEESGRLIADVPSYELWSRVFLAGLFRRIASDVAAVAPPRGEVLEVGAGPGHLAVRLARDHGLRVTATDLDPAMVVRERANVARAFGRAAGDKAAGPGAVDRPDTRVADSDPQPSRSGSPTCIEADVAALPFDEGSFDVVVSTFSMHHWADPIAGLAEIHRVLRPGGRALIWDFARFVRRMEGHSPDPADVARRSPFATADVRRWRWPGPLPLVERIELVRLDAVDRSGADRQAPA